MVKVTAILAFCTILLLGDMETVAQSSSGKPNIIVFIADDAGMDFGAYGNQKIKTPNIDQLAAGGLLCENAFLTTSQCSPTRTSILSGQFAHTIGTEDLHFPLDENTKLVPYYLQQEGYYTGLLMKQHLGKNGNRQFDFVKESSDNEAPDLFRQFLTSAGEKPFFAWVAFHDPHKPYGGEGGAEKVHNPKDVIVPPYMVDAKATREELALYYDEIHRMDRNIGAILQELEKRGIKDNTFIAFLSDNGMPFPRGKATLYDFGMKTPLIIQWPGKVDKGVRYDKLVSVIDLAPTILDIAGIEKPAQMYGRSIKPVFTDQSVAGREYIFGERNWHDTDEHMRAIRSDRYKLIINGYPELLFPITGDYFRSGAWYDLLDMKKKGKLNRFQEAIFEFPRAQAEFYDLENDPYEVNNLIDDPKHIETAFQMSKILQQWEKETNDHPPFKKRRSDFIDRKSAFFFNHGRHADFKNFGYWDE